ncbi:hypothetical protein [Photorhabdus asymbiotica]|uniref:hypothetical protein n=1 Tax=Photorhabdus asymbiotica TaxID=291112 RepID=UPI003DA74955
MFKESKEFIEIDITKASSDELLSLIHIASTELRNRLKQPAVVRVVESKPIVTAPPQHEERFIRNCLKKSYVHASMKDDYKNSAKKYPEWFEINKLPTDLRGSELKKYREYYSDDE